MNPKIEETTTEIKTPSGAEIGALVVSSDICALASKPVIVYLLMSFISSVPSSKSSKQKSNLLSDWSKVGDWKAWVEFSTRSLDRDSQSWGSQLTEYSTDSHIGRWSTLSPTTCSIIKLFKHKSSWLMRLSFRYQSNHQTRHSNRMKPDRRSIEPIQESDSKRIKDSMRDEKSSIDGEGLGGSRDISQWMWCLSCTWDQIRTSVIDSGRDRHLSQQIKPTCHPSRKSWRWRRG